MLIMQPILYFTKLLRHLLSHLSTDHKAKLLRDVHDLSTNPSGSTPLPKTGTHLEAKTRLLFNRLVVTNVAGSANQTSWDNNLQDSSCRSFADSNNPEVLLDAELILLTQPLRFLVDLILLPITRRCPSSQTAVHQLLLQLSYCFPVSINECPRSSLETLSPDRTLEVPTMLSVLFLNDLVGRRRSSKPSLWSGWDYWDPDQDSPFPFDSIVTTLQSSNADPSRATFEGSPLPLKHQIVQTVAYILEMFPWTVPDLVSQFYRLLNSLLVTTTFSTETAERVLLVFLSALLSGNMTAALSSSQREHLGVHLIDLFALLFLSEPFKLGSTCPYELDGLLVQVVLTLLSKDMSSHRLLERLYQMLQNVSTLEPITPQTLRAWILWRPSFEKLSEIGYVEWTVPATIQVLFPPPRRMPSLELLREKFRLIFPEESTSAAMDSDGSQKPFSPRTLSFVLSICSVSADSLFTMVGLLRSSVSCLGPDRIPPSSLLLALLVVLHTPAVLRQVERWIRIISFLDHLVCTELLLLPYRSPIGFREHRKRRTHLLPLVDWSAARGTLDMFALFSDLLQLWNVCAKRTISQNDRCEQLQTLCQTMIFFTHRLARFVEATLLTEDRGTSFKQLIRIHSELLLDQVMEHLDDILSNSNITLSRTASSDVSRLQMAVQTARNFKHGC